MMHDMDYIDRQILTILKDKKARDFQQFLSEVDFSHNTLRQHLDTLIDQGIVERSKRPRAGPGRPRFTYCLSRSFDVLTLSAFLDPYQGLVVIPFDVLSRLCRHEKGGYCKEMRRGCDAGICPKIVK